jgi:hypothetical protein
MATPETFGLKKLDPVLEPPASMITPHGGLREADPLLPEASGASGAGRP